MNKINFQTHDKVFGDRPYIAAPIVVGLIFIFSIAIWNIEPVLAQEADQEENKYLKGQPVEVVSTGMNFNLPDEIKSGWVTFSYENKSKLTHFLVLEKMPQFKGDQKTVEDSKAEVVPAFQNIMDAILAGKEELPVGGLPEWYNEVKFVGGTGLIAPGKTAVTSLKLEPGTYVIECYVKSPDGVFHSSVGMIEGLKVTEESSKVTAPRPTVEMYLSSKEGITFDKDIRPGKHIIAVHFKDQKVQEHFLGFDVHLADIKEGTDIDELAAWMDWSKPGGLATPAPVEFLGGTQEMPGGNTAYFIVDLKPGKYAWIAEVPDPAKKGMLKTFTVPSGNNSSK
ncbi:MAG: hypothetical protein GVY07_15485 [Bacteroidetes bacterium]|jgi:hypothetical protein|nr:hypothetical protein [Bacteroidota bacterium]